jgi:hypothetical protein
VDSPAQIELIRPWRTATLVASGVAAVELIALVVLGLVLGPHVHAAAAKAAREPKHAAAAAAKHEARPKPVRHAHAARILPRSKIGVVVMNGNGINGAAAQAASIVRARGYAVTATKNAPRTGYPTWRLMTAPGYAAEAIRLARDLDLGRSRVGPLDGMTTKQLHGAKLVLILGTNR